MSPRAFLRATFYRVRNLLVKYFNLFLPVILRQVIVQSNPISDIRAVWSFIYNQTRDIPLVRFGGQSDGGYFCPDVLSSVSYVFSPGYGGVKSFEDEMVGLGKRVFICDPEFKDVENLLTLQEFDCLALSDHTMLRDKKISLSDWVDSKVGVETKHMLLQIDIEGAEWKVLSNSTSELLRRFDVILIEIHNLNRLIFDREFLSEAQNVVSKFRFDFINVYSRANNCGGFFHFKGKKMPNVVELSLINKLCFEALSTKRIYSPINDEDFLNSPNLPPIHLPKI
jgi:hypothetical protein